MVIKNKYKNIELTNRKMWYSPWPVDRNGKYKKPFHRDIDKIYGISGKAVREALLYFEECDGNTEELIDLLNNYVTDNRFYINRSGLLNKSRWYTNEYYFYFIMFLKKIIGRWNFRFGENSNEILSKFHRPFEKSCLTYIPWGRDEKNKKIKGIGGYLVIATYLLAESIIKKKEKQFNSKRN